MTIACGAGAPTETRIDPRGLERVRELFFEQIDAGLHPGAALAVYHHGELVLDLYGGLADKETGRPVDHDTMFVLYSSTKPVTASCLHILWERGKLRWTDHVADHWPEFAQSGKDEVTIGQVLTHRGGFPDSPSHMTWDRWSDWDAAVGPWKNSARTTLPEGSSPTTHATSAGSSASWCAALTAVPSTALSARRSPARWESMTCISACRSGFCTAFPGSMPWRTATGAAKWNFTTPRGPPYGAARRRRDLHRQGARPLLRRDADGGTLDGVSVMRPETVDEVTAAHSEGIDHSLNRRVIRGMGLALADPRTGDSDKLDPRTFGHAGSGTSVGWANRDTGLAVAYITNGFRAELTNTPRLAAISQAITNACA